MIIEEELALETTTSYFTHGKDHVSFTYLNYTALTTLNSERLELVK